MNQMENTNWTKALKPLIEKYKNKKHPLDYNNLYELMVMVILSAQDSDANINKVAPSLFKAFPNLQSLAKSSIEELIPHIIKVRNFNTKASWIIEIAQTLKTDNNIPTTMDELVALKGIGRKSANVIMREAEAPAEGIICDLHVIRVAPRIGLTQESTDGNKIEKQLMQLLPNEIWNEIGMAISFLGRETCRPTNPKCSECPVQNDCQYPLKTI
jgi:endonuclease III